VVVKKCKKEQHIGESFMDLRQIDDYADFLKKIGWIVEFDKNSKSLIYIRKLPMTGFSVLKIQRPQKLLSKESLYTLVKKYKVLQCNIEPTHDQQTWKLTAWKFRRQKIPFLPSNTILLSLELNESQLKKQMKSKTRYNIRLAQKKGVEVKTIDGISLMKNKSDFDDLFFMQKQNAKRLGIFILPKNWFYKQIKALGDKCFATMAYFNNDLVAATFYMTSDDTAYYSHNGSTKLGRKVFAPTLCAWHGMLEGKRRGLAHFDFEGIYDSRSNVKRWKGFTRFKKGFGGREHMTAGLYSKWVWPF
jgi:lipid II:glycine glycyltransferase (peptidoglycan interpeptide bridge formation enzyme)